MGLGRLINFIASVALTVVGCFAVDFCWAFFLTLMEFLSLDRFFPVPPWLVAAGSAVFLGYRFWDSDRRWIGAGTFTGAALFILTVMGTRIFVSLV